jgi:hypothetical protein
VDPVDPDPKHWLCNVWARTVRNLSGHFETFIIRICCTFSITKVKGLFLTELIKVYCRETRIIFKFADYDDLRVRADP